MLSFSFVKNLDLNGVVNLLRAAKALSVSDETIECALNLFDESENIAEVTRK